MSRTPRRLWTALPVAALILAAAVWPTSAGTEAAAAPTARTTYTMTIPAAAFIPALTDVDYVNSGWYLHGSGGMQLFLAPVQFPYPEVTVSGITLHAYDNGTNDVCLAMARARPGKGTAATMASFCSSGQSTTDPRSFPTPEISNRTVNARYHGAYLQLMMPSDLAYKFYGVTIRYQA